MESKKLYTKWTWMLLLILFGWVGIAQAQEPVQEPVQAQTQEQVQAQEPALEQVQEPEQVQEQEPEQERALNELDEWSFQTAGEYKVTSDKTLNGTINLSGNLILHGSRDVTIHKGNFDGSMFKSEGHTLTIIGATGSGERFTIDGGADISDYSVDDPVGNTHTSANGRPGHIIELRGISSLYLTHVRLQRGWTNHEDGQSGGAILADNVNANHTRAVLQMTDCVVRGCYSLRSGSALTFPENSWYSATLTDCYFHHNYANGRWTDSSGNIVSYGGTIRSYGGTKSTLYITGCEIHHNYSGFHGGGIAWNGSGDDPNTKLTITGGTKIYDNKAYHWGGGIYCGGSLSNVLDAEIYNNVASNSHDDFCGGGGIAAVSYAGPMREFGGGGLRVNLDHADVKIYNNSTREDGGGVLVLFRASDFTGIDESWHPVSQSLATSYVLIDKCRIHHNTAKRGGGVCVYDGMPLKHHCTTSGHTNVTTDELIRYVRIDGGEICNNTATERGGGLCVVKSDGYSPATDFQNNRNAGELNVYLASGKVFANKCTGTSGGGGVAIYDRFQDPDEETPQNPSECYVHVNGAIQIKGNRSYRNGGGVHLGYADLTMSNGDIGSEHYTYTERKHYSNGVLVNETTHSNISGANIANGSEGGNGGGVAVVGGDFTKSGGHISYNQAKQANNERGNGGGIFVTDGKANLSSDNGTVKSNTADTYGGGIYVSGDGEVTVGGTVNENTAISRGGGFYVTGDGEVKVVGDVIDNTVSNGNGGGGYVTGNGNVEIIGNLLRNHAIRTGDTGGHGGGLYVAGQGIVTIGGKVNNNTATNNGGGFYTTSDATLKLSGMISYNTAINGGGGYVNQGSVTLESQTNIFENTASNAGGGIYSRQGNLEIKDQSHIYSNHALSSHGGGIYVYDGIVNIPGGLLMNNDAFNGNGGGLYTRGNVNISGGVIGSNNSAINGGGFYVANNGNVMFTTGTVTGNIASHDGGGFYVYGNGSVTMSGSVSYNSATHDGGGFYVTAGDGSVDVKGTVQENTAGNDGGGAYFGNRGVTLQTGLNYIHNIATHYGGGLFLKAGTLTYSNGNVTQNEAVKGGGIYVDNSGSINFVTGTLGNNKALGNTQTGEEGHGGGIYANGGPVTMNGTASSNTATHYGGGLYSNGSTVSMGGSANSNEAGHDGGGIYANGGSVTTSGALNSNKALGNNGIGGDGGGIYSNGAPLTMNGGSANSNTAAHDGGGIYSNNAPVTINGGSVSYNTAANNGGGCYLNEGSISSTGTFSTNSATVYGGGLYATEGAGAVALNGQFDNNTAVLGGGAYILSRNVTQNNCRYLQNIAEMGGGLHLLGGSLNSVNGNFSNNQATTGHGGGIYAITTGSITENGTVYNNTATGNGGGMYILDCDPLTLSGLINNNQANGTFSSDGETTGFGGGVYAITTSDVSMDGSVNSNTAVADGGGMYILDCNTLYLKGSVSSNHANGTVGNEDEGEITGYGGGVYVIPGENGERNVTVENGTISSNTAAADGGGMYVLQCSNLEVNGTVSSNHAYGTDNNDEVITGYGGGIYVIPAEDGDREVTVSGTVSSNTAVADGGGMYVLQCNSLEVDGTVSSNHAYGTASSDEVITGYGGGIYVIPAENGDREVTVSGELSYNTAAVDGGGLYTTGTDLVTVTGAANGGVIGNTAEGDGGGLFVTPAEGGQVNLSGTVRENQATNGGGAYTNGGTISYLAGKASRNNASNNGGAFYTYGGVTNMNDGVIVGGELTCDGSTSLEEGNTATNGGGIYIANAVNGEDVTGGVLNTGACTISSNMVTNKGGGIYVESKGSTDADKTVVHNNGALGGGGGIYHDGGTLTYADGEVTDNKTAYTTLEECSQVIIKEDFENGVFSDGWVVWTSGHQFECPHGWWVVQDDVHNGSYSAKGTCGYGLASSNAVLETTQEFPAGGVVSFYKKVHTLGDDPNVYTDATFRFSVENEDTGEFTWLGTWSGNDEDWSQVTFHFDAGRYTFRWYYWKNYPSCNDDYAWIDDIRFETIPVQEPNTQWAEEASGGTGITYYPANGGGIYMNNNGTTTITKSNITGNIATKDGGGIYHPGGELSCTDGTVSSYNTAWNDGGGVYVNNANLTYSDGEVSFNRAGLLTYDEVSPEVYNIDGFETGDFSAFNWQSSGDSPWTISDNGASEGTYCAIANGIATGTNANSTLTLTMDIPYNNSTISFFRKLTRTTGNTQNDNFICNFYIDNVEKDHWSGPCEWGEKSYSVSSGTHVFKWTFGNRTTLSQGETEEDYGCAWIDNIKVGPIERAEYEYHWKLGSGGGVYAANGVANITESTITRNVASVNGGGLYLDNCVSPTQITGSLTRNSAFVNGGGLYANMGEILVSGIVSHNTAVDGGGTYMNGGTITYNDCNINHNAASNNGGGLYTKGGETNINNSIINFQKAANGGGVYIAESGSLNMEDCNISDNQAFGNGETGGDGGGIYVEEGTTIAKTTILNSNEALNNGGGMYMDAGSLTYTDGSIENNWTTVVESPESNLMENFDSGDFSANDWHVSGEWSIVNEHSGNCAKAGTLCHYSENSISVTADVPVATTISFYRKIKDFYTQYFYIDDVEMSEQCIKRVIAQDWEQVTYPVLAGTHTFKWAGYGTGNFWIDDILLEVPLHEVYEDAGGNGAGLYANGGSVTLTGSENLLLPVIQNTAMNNGGGIYTRNSAEVSVTYSTFENNKANGGMPNGGNGGGICMTDGSSGSLTAGQSNFQNNLAFAHGGGMYIEGSTTTMTSCDVLENTSGEMIVSAGSNFANSHEDGLAHNDGRVIYFSEGDGGGIYQTGGSLTFTEGNVTDNRAVRNGGGIHAVGGTTTTVEESDVKNNMANGHFEFEEEHITDDFETGDFSHLDWHTYSDDDDETYGLWIVKEKPNGEGYCAASGDISDHLWTKNTYLTITMYYPMPGQVTFSRRFYGSQYKHAMFYIDGQEQFNLSGGYDWETVSFDVPESGTHTFTWRFWLQPVLLGDYSGNHFLIDDVQFTSVPAVDTTVIAQSHGGGIYHANGSLECTTVSIEENSATGNGGGICAISNTAVTATDATIEENTADLNGGGVYSQENTTITVAGSASRNIAALSGGGIYATGGNQVIVEASVDDNKANDGDGGGLYATNISTLVEATGTAERNIAKLNGGGIYVTNSGEVNVEANVDDNAANSGNGGGLYLVGNGPVTMAGTAEDNTAKLNGGGIYATSDDSMTVDATVDRNAANGGSGGGLYISDVSTFVDMTGSANNNVAATGSGGGMFVTNSGTVTVDATIDHNVANGGDGGGLYLVDNGPMEITGSASHNTASYNGGGIYATGDDSMTLDDINADVNYAKDGDGGGIYVSDIATVTMSGSANQNIATGNGGGAYLKNSAVTVLNGTEVNDNAATDNGGGIYLTGGSSSLSYTSSEINRNTAIHGGGAYIENGVAHFKDDTELKSNTATSGNGGGINLEDGQLQLTSAHVDDNKALISTIPSLLNFVEDFETGNFTGHDWQWQTNGYIVAAPPYTGDNVYGNYCAKPGTVTEPTELSITLDFPTAGLIIFDYFSRTIDGGGSISIDGVVADSWGSTYSPWGATTKWMQKSVNVSAGTHTLKWRYTPGEDEESGWYGCWLDNIRYEAIAAPTDMASTNTGMGGGIYLGGGALQECSSSTVNSNIATFDGGGIYTKVDMLTFNNDTVSSNTSMMGDGGGIHIIEGRQANIVGGSVDNNTALTGRSGRGVRHNNRDEAIISESFETGDFSAFNWTTYGRYNGQLHYEESYKWTVVAGDANTGSFYAQSGPISANLGNSSDQSTDLILSIELPTPCILSFFRQVKCHIRYLSTYCDFYVDGYKQATFEGPVSSWGQYAYYPVSAGTHTFKWSFVRNRCDTDYTDDYARIDDIQFTPIVYPEVYPELAKKGNGGGLFVGNGSTVTYAGGKITENESVEGGGIFIDGSGIYLSKDQTSTENNSTEISNNMALGHGGGIYLRNGFIDYADGSVNHNTAVDGGGIYLQDGQGTVNNCNIDYNNAVNGNPADNFFEGFERGNFSAYNWQFEGNTHWTVVEGGANSGRYSAKSSTSNCAIILNTDLQSDGVISFFVKGKRTRRFKFYVDGVQKINGSDYEGDVWKQATINVAAGNHTFKWYMGADNYDNYCTWVDDIQFTANSNEVANGAGDGGGLYAGESSIVFEGCNFTNNTAATNGGGIYLHEKNALTLNGPTTVNSNTAAVDGGGIYIPEQSVLNLHGANTVSNNHVLAEGHGGGIYQNGTLYLGEGTNPHLRCMDNFAGDEWQFDPEQGLNNRNNIYLPSREKYVTVTSDVSGKTDGIHYDTRMGFTVYNSDAYEGGIPVVHVEDPDNEPWLYNLVSDISEDNGAVFDDESNLLVVHTRRNIDPYFNKQFIYLMGCWTTVVTRNPGTDHIKLIGDTYHIYTNRGLAWFSSLVNGLNRGPEANQNQFDGPQRELNAVLEADVNMARYLWVPLGAITNYNDNSSTFTEVDNDYYNANFNGQGHIISGLINTVLIKVRRFGLFGAVGRNAIVKNTLVDNYINIAVGEDIYYMGGITGVANRGARIFNCEARGSSSIYESKDLENTGKKSYGGGIVGYLDNGVSLHSCMAMPYIEGKNSLIGGIAGNLPSSNSIKNCFVNGAFERCDEASLIGGLVGDNQGLVENCYVRMQAGSTEPDNFSWFGGANSGNFRFCYAPLGETNYGSGNISGHGNFGPTHTVSTKYGFAQQDQQVTKAPGQTNNYIVNGLIGANGELTGLLPTLNNWVKDPANGWDESQNMNDNGYSLWTRTMASTMNDDYPVLEFNDFVCVSSKDGNFMSYGYDLNEKIEEYNGVGGDVTVLDQIDFEDGQFPAGWYNYNSSNPWVVSETSPHGHYCLSSDPNIPDSHTWPYYSRVDHSLEFTEKGTISFFARAVGGEGYFSAGDYGVSIESDAWTYYSIDVPAGPCYMTWSYNTWDQGAGIIYIDDITFTQRAPYEFAVFDFEDAIVPATWTNDANYPWVVMSTNNLDQSYAYEGMYCIASSNFTDNDQGTTSSISATVTYTQDGRLSFYGKTGGYNGDLSHLYIDGALVGTYYSNSSYNWEWQQHVYEIPAGTHTMTWQYERNETGTSEGYRYFIDKVVFSEPMRDRKVAYLYKPNPTEISANTDEGVRVYVKPDISVMQAQGNHLNARVGVAFDNSSVNFMSSDWHLFSSALTAAPTGLKYTSIGRGYYAEYDTDPDYQGDYWIANNYCNGVEQDGPYGGYYDNGIPHDVFTTVQKMAPPKTRWKPTIGQFGYFPTDTPYGPWRGQTPQQAYDAGEEIHVGFFDFYTWDEPSYHWINLKRNGFECTYSPGSKSDRSEEWEHYPDHWHEDATEDGHHLRIDYTNEKEMVPGKGYMMSISKPSILMTDGVLNNDDVNVNLTARASLPTIGGGGGSSSDPDCNNTETYIMATVEFATAGTVTFFSKTSSEESWDYGYFYIDNVEKLIESGNTDWNEHSYEVSAGTHTLKWSYVKDGSGYSGNDRYFIDDITFTGVSGGPVSINFEDGQIPTTWTQWGDHSWIIWDGYDYQNPAEIYPYSGNFCMASGNCYLDPSPEPDSGSGSGSGSSSGWVPMSETYTETFRGANLIGNPYHSYLDFDAFAEENDINTYYIFNADKRGFIAHVHGGSTPVTTGNYNVSHQQFGANGSSGGEQIVGDEVIDYSAPQFLHPHQGFFVKVENNKNAKFTNDMRVQDVESAFRSKENHYPMVDLICSDTAGRNEFATVEVGRPDKGGGRKIKGLHMGDASLWVRFDNKDWHVAFTPLGTKSVPVRFKAYTDGVFTMRWQAANTNFSYLHLIDNITGVDIDCLAEEQYIFEGKTSDYLSRFKLVFDFENNEAPEVPEEPEEPENPEPAEELTIFAFQMGDQLIVNGEGMLQMFDVQGRCLLQENMVGAQSAVSLPKVANGVYVLRLTCTNKVKTQKIVINKFK